MSGFQPYEGANEIVERLRAELAAADKERNGLLDDRTALIADCDALRSERQRYWQSKNELIAELAAMRQQRDEARRLYRALLDGIKDAASPREKEGGGA